MLKWASEEGKVLSPFEDDIALDLAAEAVGFEESAWPETVQVGGKVSDTTRGIADDALAKVAGLTFFVLVVDAANCVVECSVAEEALAKDTAGDGVVENAGPVLALPGKGGTGATAGISVGAVMAMLVDDSLAQVASPVFILPWDSVSEVVLAEPTAASDVLGSFPGATLVTDGNGFEEDAEVSKANLASANGAELVADESVVEDWLPVDGIVRNGLVNVAGPNVGFVSDDLSRVGEAEVSAEGDDLGEGFGLDKVAGGLHAFFAATVGCKASNVCWVDFGSGDARWTEFDFGWGHSDCDGSCLEAVKGVDPRLDADEVDSGTDDPTGSDSELQDVKRCDSCLELSKGVDSW